MPSWRPLAGCITFVWTIVSRIGMSDQGLLETLLLVKSSPAGQCPPGLLGAPRSRFPASPRPDLTHSFFAYGPDTSPAGFTWKELYDRTVPSVMNVRETTDLMQAKG
jgi:hypothetical protein